MGCTVWFSFLLSSFFFGPRGGTRLSLLGSLNSPTDAWCTKVPYVQYGSTHFPRTICVLCERSEAVSPRPNTENGFQINVPPCIARHSP
ncbi:hypothetical protein BGZ57DRAFT_548003 [Hyaloscypha finlandica]|nr:hypothetical protein BGZ57DRAFT_548003 [Hyaloscypha finlandica]